MTMKIILSFVLLLLIYNITSAQTKCNDFLNARVDNIKIREENSLAILGEIAIKHDVKIGMETSPNDANFRKSLEVYEVKDGTVEDLLNVFIKLHPEYKWSVKDGFVNIYPTSDSWKERILDVKISHISVKSENSSEISYKIINHPDVLDFLKILQLVPNNDSSDFGNIVKEQVFSFEQKNQTMREVLNYMLQNKIIKYWAIYRNVGIREYVKLIIR